MSPAPVPELDWPLTAPFWEAARSERFVMPRCSSCARLVWYPEDACPDCQASGIPWVEVSGRGRLFAWAEVKHPLYAPYEAQLPYVTGIVTLEEDPRVRYVTRIVDCDVGDLVIEMPSEVTFRALAFAGVEGIVVAPVFRPVCS